jgi:ribosomal protein S18 acetylase RimI-like enzyme
MFPSAEYPLTPEKLESTVESRFDSTVILLHDEIAAFANFYEATNNQHCSIGNVIVNSKFRNLGIGEFLVKTMENIGMKKYNVSEFRISCFNTNTKGILLYSKLGYKPYEIEKRENHEHESIALIKFKRIM